VILHLVSELKSASIDSISKYLPRLLTPEVILPFHDKGPCCSRCQLVAFSVGHRWFAYPADEYISYAAQGHSEAFGQSVLCYRDGDCSNQRRCPGEYTFLSPHVLDNFFRKGLFMDFTLDNTATSESGHLIHLDRLE